MNRFCRTFLAAAAAVLLLVPAAGRAAVPVMNIEGEGGGGLVPWAYLTNPPAQGEILGGPTVAATYIFPQNFNVNVYHINQSVTDRVELGYSRTVFDTTNLLGGVGVDELVMDTLHAKFLLLKESDVLPAVSLSLEYKKNRDIDTADRNLRAAFGAGTDLTAAGLDDDSGVDACVSVTKLFKETPLSMPVLVNLGARYTKAAQTGYLGFSDHAKVLPEVTLAVLPESNVAVGVEYRIKPDEYREVAGIGSFAEDDWSDFFIAYFPTPGLSIVGAVVNFGNIVNRNVNTGLYMNMKFDF